MRTDALVDHLITAMGAVVIPGSRSLQARYTISPELLQRMTRAALAALHDHGYAVVPVEPTPAMIAAGRNEIASPSPQTDAEECWAAMLKAASTPTDTGKEGA